MVNTFRFLIVLAAAVVLATAVLPFDHPLDVDLLLGSAPPAWVLGFLCMLVAALVAIPAVIGLLRLRRWGRVIGALVAGAAVFGALVTFRSPIAAAAGPLITAMLAAGVIAWCSGVALAFHPAVATRFRA
jgi:hypothetical protein